MRRTVLSLAVAATMAAGVARAQTHVVKKPETVVRAVGVYEFTGDETKVTASRLIPVSIYINAELEDAGVYKAAPVPFTLERGNVFELERAGVPKGTLQIAYVRHLQSDGDITFDDGWLGYGAFKPAPKPALVAGRQSGPLPQLMIDGKPAPASANETQPPAKRPPVDRSTAASGRVSASGTVGGEDDDDSEPTLVRKPVAAPSTPAGGGQDTTVDAGDKADRPTLQHRDTSQTPDSTQSKNKKPRRQGDVASVRSAGSLNDDPDRPTIHRGPPPGALDETTLPPLEGLPKDMKQMVAVSDAKDRPEHVFTRAWDSDDERAAVLAKMEDAARARLARYDSVTGLSTAAAPATAAAPVSKSAAGRKKAVAQPAAVAPIALADEQLTGYTLSYGGAPTFVYTASSPGAKGATQYVTIVAQREMGEELKLALISVTDSTHLDRTAWMRPIDAVDAEASNRASLLFELRAQHTRQFALYRVIGAQADQTLVTGSNP